MKFYMFLICSLSLIYPIYIPYRFLAYLSLILRWGSDEVPIRFRWGSDGDRGHIRGNILGSYKYYLIDNEFFYHINISSCIVLLFVPRHGKYNIKWSLKCWHNLDKNRNRVVWPYFIWRVTQVCVTQVCVNVVFLL